MTLRLQSVTKRFGALVADDSLSLEFQPGRITSVIGPNGAGKSTLINLCAGSYRVTSGRILLDGLELQQAKKHEIARAGVARTYQNIRLFDGMTVLQNLEVCLYPEFVEADVRRSLPATTVTSAEASANGALHGPARAFRPRPLRSTNWRATCRMATRSSSRSRGRSSCGRRS